MHYRDLISKSLFFKDLAIDPPKSLIPKDHSKGDLEMDSRIGWCNQDRSANSEKRSKPISTIDPETNL